MLKPITNWSALRRALRARRQEIYLCEDCGHVWLSASSESPARCPRPDCHALANSPKRETLGRPSL